jgi:hypothetical protein
MRSVDLVLVAVVAGLPARGDAEEPGHPARAAPPAHDDATRASRYTPEEIRATVVEHVRRAAEESGGVYRIRDEQTGKTLDLEFLQVAIVSAGGLWRVHDPDRHPDGRTFFACTRFHAAGAPREKIFDVDVQVEPREEQLTVTDVRIHKEKQLVNGEWIWEVRPPMRGDRAGDGNR